MARRSLILGALCAILGVSAAAQTTPSGTARTPSLTPQPLRLTGCLKPWDPSTMGPPPSAHGTDTRVTGGPATAFVLTNAEPAARDTTTPPVASSGQPPISGRGATQGGHASYLLTPATPSVNFSAHVDQQVEITGTLVADETAATPAAQPPPTPSATPQPGDAQRAPDPPVAFTVTAITVVEKACLAK